MKELNLVKTDVLDFSTFNMIEPAPLDVLKNVTVAIYLRIRQEIVSGILLIIVSCKTCSFIFSHIIYCNTGNHT